MAFIPSQAIELSISVYLNDDTRMNITLFPLASHHKEHPIDLVLGYLNGRKGDFFPIRMPDGNEMILPMADCYVFDLTKRAEEEILDLYPTMARSSMIRDAHSVVTYSEVSLSLKSGRTVRGNFWYHNYIPENERNLLDYLNNAGRYVVLHGKRQTFIVLVKAVKKAQLLVGEAMASDDNGDPLLPKSVQSTLNLVDTSMAYAAVEGAPKQPARRLSRKVDTAAELLQEEEEHHSSTLRENISGVFGRFGKNKDSKF